MASSSTTANFEEKRKALLAKNIMFGGGQRPPLTRPKPTTTTHDVDDNSGRVVVQLSDTLATHPTPPKVTVDTGNGHLERIEKLRQLRLSRRPSPATKVDADAATDDPTPSVGLINGRRQGSSSPSTIDRIKERITIDPTTLRPKPSPILDKDSSSPAPNHSLEQNLKNSGDFGDTKQKSSSLRASDSEISFTPTTAHKPLAMATKDRPKGHTKRRPPTSKSSKKSDAKEDSLIVADKAFQFPDSLFNQTTPSTTTGHMSKSSHKANPVLQQDASTFIHELGKKLTTDPRKGSPRPSSPSPNLDVTNTAGASYKTTTTTPKIKLSPTLLAEKHSKLKHNTSKSPPVTPSTPSADNPAKILKNLNRNNNNSNHVAPLRYNEDGQDEGKPFTFFRRKEWANGVCCSLIEKHLCHPDKGIHPIMAPIESLVHPPIATKDIGLTNLDLSILNNPISIPHEIGFIDD